MPAIAGLGTLAWILWHLPALTSAAHWNSDAAAPALIAESLARDPSGHTVLGDVSSLSTLLVYRATEWLPAHRALWAAVPYAVSLVGIALLAYASWRLAGRWAAATTAALAVAVTTDVLFTQLAPAFRATTWATMALLAAVLVAAARRSHGGPGPMAVAMAAGAATGLGVISDPLTLVVGVVPFAVAALVATMAVQRRRWLVAPSVAFVVAGAVAAGIGLSLMDGWGLATHTEGSGYVARARLDTFTGHFGQWWQSLVAMASGTQGDWTPPWWGWPAVLALAAMLVAIPVLAVRALMRRRDIGAAVLGFRVFWAVVVLALTVGFVGSGIPNRLGGVTVDRYLVPLVLAVAACLPVALARPARMRWLGALAALALMVPGMVLLWRGDLVTRREAYPNVRQATAMAAWLRTEGATTGYSDYFDALSLTYQRGIDVRPAQPCQSGPALCPSAINTRDVWYRPVRGRTFLLMNSGTVNGRDLAAIVAAMDLPPVVARRTFEGVQVMVLARDVRGAPN